jgi:hypothetical protein
VPLALRPNEQVLFPTPYVENEHNPLIITTARVHWAGDNPKKPKEIDAAKITTSVKGYHQKFVLVMLILGLVGAPFLIIGGYKYYSYRDKPTEKPAEVKGVKSKLYTPNELKQFENNKTQKIVGIVLVAFGAAFGGVAYLLYKRRLTVVIAGQGKILNIPVKSAIVQDQMLTMVNAAKTAAAAMAPMPVADKVQKQGAPPPKLSK